MQCSQLDDRPGKYKNGKIPPRALISCPDVNTTFS